MSKSELFYFCLFHSFEQKTNGNNEQENIGKENLENAKLLSKPFKVQKLYWAESKQTYFNNYFFTLSIVSFICWGMNDVNIVSAAKIYSCFGSYPLIWRKEFQNGLDNSCLFSIWFHCDKPHGRLCYPVPWHRTN